jgi:hypothetical protein
VSTLTANVHWRLIGETAYLLVIAWRNSAAYPQSHPALTASFQRVHRKLTDLTLSTGPLIVGVNRNGLLLGEERLESIQARTLAQALGEHRVAAVRIEHGVEPADLQGLFRLLRTSAAGEKPLSERLAGAGVRHIELELLDYSSIRTTDQTGPDEPGAGAPPPPHERLVYRLLHSHDAAPRHGAVRESRVRRASTRAGSRAGRRGGARCSTDDAGLPADGSGPATADGSGESRLPAAEDRGGDRYLALLPNSSG